LREPRGRLPGPVRACACSLYINKKKISVVKLQQFFGDEVRSGPGALLCVSAWVGDEVRRAPARLLCVSACELNFSLVY